MTIVQFFRTLALTIVTAIKAVIAMIAQEVGERIAAGLA